METGVLPQIDYIGGSLRRKIKAGFTTNQKVGQPVMDQSESEVDHVSLLLYISCSRAADRRFVYIAENKLFNQLSELQT